MKHNKKRNIGLIYELFLRHMSKCIVEDDKKNLKIATDVVSKSFDRKKELYKEFRVFNALSNANLGSNENAVNLLRESKNIIQNINSGKLTKEKSFLIKEINYKINNKNFYYSRVENYKDLGTIQLLFNEWKKKDNSNLLIEKELEDKVILILLKNKIKINEELNNTKKENDIETSDIVFNIMTEKINKKYKTMTSSQKEIIKNYCLYNENTKKLESFLGIIKENCKSRLREFKLKNENDYLSNKINNVELQINELKTIDCNDKEIVKFLTLTELIEEFNS